MTKKGKYPARRRPDYNKVHITGRSDYEIKFNTRCNLQKQFWWNI